MKIELKAGPDIIKPATGQTAPAAIRDAVVAKIEAMRAAESPVRNATQVSPEEMSAIKAPSRVQNSTIESGSEAPLDAVEAKPAAKDESDAPLSSQHAILARKEKALRERARAMEAQIKAKEEALLAKEAEFKARESEYSSKYVAKDKLTMDPLAVLSELGLTYDQITELALNAPKAEDMQRTREYKALQDELKAIKDAQERAQKTYEDQQTQAYKQAVSQIKSDVSDLVRQDPTFETIKATNSINDVVDLIEKTYQKDGILLSVEEAATEVENYLVEEAMKIARISKIQQRLQSAKASQTKAEEPAKQPTQGLKTLTNAVSSSRQLTAKERAILAFKGELK